MNLPENYKWLLDKVDLPLIKTFLNIYGVKETIGDADNPIIMEWAKELGLKDYIHDSIAWCGLAMAKIVHDAGEPVVDHPLWAANWLKFGVVIPIQKAMLGDILIFKRPGGNHVALYLGEDATAFHVGGGNQSDMVSIANITKERCIGARRPASLVSHRNLKKIFLEHDGLLSTNEA